MNPLLRRLRSLRRRLRIVALLRGLSLLALVALGGVLTASLLDCWLDLPTFLRAVLLFGTIVTTGTVAIQYLLRLALQRLDDFTLALRIEEAYPELNDALASSVEFMCQPANHQTAGSLALRREAMQRAMKHAEACNFHKIVPARGLRWLLAAACLLIGGAATLAYQYPPTATTALLRLAHPFGEHEWDRATQLTLQYRDRVAIGQKYAIRGEVRGVVPGKVLVELEGTSTNREKREVAVTRASDAELGTFVLPLDMTRQYRDFRFRVKANDTASPRREGRWHQVRVAQPPRLVALDGQPTPQLELRIPAYTDLPSPVKLSPGTGTIEAFAGTDVILRGATDRPITHAWVEQRGNNPLLAQVAPLLSLTASSPLELATTLVGSADAWQPNAGTIAAGGQQFAITFRPWLSGSYALHIEDAETLAKDYEYDLRITPDPLPDVALLTPQRRTSLLAHAEIELRLAAVDETFALKNAWFEYWRKSRDGEVLDAVPQRLPVYDADTLGTALPLLAAGLARTPLAYPGEPLRLRAQRLEAHRRWSLERVAKLGETIVLRACAEDFNNLTATARVGYSQEVELLIVSTTELRAQLEEAEAQIQQDLQQLRDWQEKALKKVIEAEQQLQATGKARPEDLEGLIVAEQQQRNIQARVEDQAHGVRTRLEQIQQTIKQNKLPGAAVQDRLKAVKHEVDRLAREQLPQLEPKLTALRQKLEQQGDDAPPQTKMGAELGEVRKQQEEVRQTLEELLQHLERSAKVQDIKGELRNVQKEQTQLQADVDKLAKEMRTDDPQWQADANRAAELQKRLGDRTEKLLDKMSRVARERMAQDPGTAQRLEEAVREAKETQLPGEMRDSGEQLKTREKVDRFGQTKKTPPQIHRAQSQQAESLKTLDKMQNALEESRQEEVERLTRRQKQERQELDDLSQQQAHLQKKVAAANKLQDPQQRKEALQNLAGEQRQLEEQAKKKARELARLQAQQAGQQLARAAEKMGKAAQQLDQGDDPEEAQRDAQQRLEQAQDELELARDELREELAREQMVKIADHIKGLKVRQDAAVNESARLHKLVLQGGWTRVMLQTMNDDAEAQQNLARETASVSDKLKGARVFDHILKRAARSMDAAAASMQEHAKQTRDQLRLDRFPLEKEELAHEERLAARTRDAQLDASQRLQRLLDAMTEQIAAKEEPKQEEKKPKAEQPKQPKEEPMPKAKAPQGDGIPGLAQLKALRAEQHELNERTRVFAQRHPRPDDLGPDARAELAMIQQDQEDLFRLFRELLTGAQEGGKQ